MKSFCRLLWQLVLFVLVGVIGVTLSACGEGQDAQQEFSIVSLVVSPLAESVALGDSVMFSVSKVRVRHEPSGEYRTLGVTSEALDAALGDGDITPAEHDKLLEAMQAIQWSVKDETVATVSGSGLGVSVSGDLIGSTQVSASLSMELADPEAYAAAQAAREQSGEAPQVDDVTASAQLTVKSPWESIAVNPVSVNLSVGDRVELQVTATDFNHQSRTVGGGDVMFSSSDADVVTVDDHGKLTGVASGRAIITAEYQGQTARANIRVVGDGMLVSGTGEDTASIPPGETVSLAVLAMDANGNVIDQTENAMGWMSSDESVATVDQSGVVTGVAPGTVTITAQVDGKSVEFTVSVVGPVELQLTPANAVINLGDVAPLTASLVFEDGSTQIVSSDATWSSSDEQVATVDAVGVVTSLQPGEVTITARAQGLTASVMLSIVRQDITWVVTPTSATLAVGDTAQLTAYGSTEVDLTSEADWSSSNDGIASVDANGIVTAEAEGQADIVAEYNGRVFSARITVSAAKAVAVEISPSTSVLPQGLSVQLTATAQFTDGSTRDVTADVAWSSDSEGIGVDATGLAIATDQGSATLTASLERLEATAVVTGVAPVVTELTSSPTALDLSPSLAGVLSITATLSDGSTSNVTSSASYASNDETIASVVNGVVTAISEGMTTISATIDGVSVDIPVTVSGDQVSYVELSPSPVYVLPGAQQQLAATAVFTDSSTLDVTASEYLVWSSADDAVATVDQSGAVTGVAMGTTTIAAVYDDGSGPVTANVSVTVLTSDPVLLTLSAPMAEIPVGFVQNFSAIVSFTDGTTSDVTDSVAWTIGDPSVATVSVQDGPATVLGVAAGTTELTASLSGLSASATITVRDVGAEPFIVIEPAQVDVPQGAQHWFVATLYFDNGLTADVSDVCTWSVEDPTECVDLGAPTGNCLPSAGPYVSISNAAGSEGVATANQITVNQNPEDVTAPDVFRAVIVAERSGIRATARMGVISDKIQHITMDVVDAAGNSVTLLPLGEEARLVATCTYEDGRQDPDCAKLLDFSSAQDSVTLDSEAHAVLGSKTGEALIAPVTPPNASDTLTTNSVELTVGECTFDSLSIELSDFSQQQVGTDSVATLPLGGASQAFAVLDDADGVCEPFTIASSAVWSADNSSVTLSENGMVTAGFSPEPPATEWANVYGEPGLQVALTAVHMATGGNELTDSKNFVLREACVAALTSSPAIGNRQPVPPDGEESLFQSVRIIGNFDDPSLADVELTEAEGLQGNVTIVDSNGQNVSTDAFTKAFISEAGQIGVPSGANEGTFRVRVTAGGIDRVQLPGGESIALCDQLAASEFTVTTVNSAVTGVTIAAPDDGTALYLGQAVQLKADANFADDSIPPWDVTLSSTWGVSDPEVFSELLLGHGVAGPVQGSTVVSAAYGGQLGALQLEVSGSAPQ